MNTTKTVTVERLVEIARLLEKYSHLYFDALAGKGHLSARHYGWMSDYDCAADTHPAVWGAYCEKHGLFVRHTSRDIVC